MPSTETKVEVVDLNKDALEQQGAYHLFIKATADTTLHGIRYVFDRDASLFRRLLWLLVVLVCAAWFIVQLNDRVTVYMSNPTAVAMEIVYGKTLRFPDVILCNQNVFKTTRLSNDAFDSVKDVLSKQPDQLTAEDFVKLARVAEIHLKEHGTGVNMTEEYFNGCHLIENMLIDCKFRGENCSAANFVSVKTDYGICYKFTFDDDALDVPNSGSGLSLLINVEEYAYGYGQRMTTGVQLLLKDSREMSLISGQGISISTGGQTTVALELSQSTQLTPPWGECDWKPLKYYKNYSESACWLECMTNTMLDKCQCVTFFLTDQVENCDFVRYFNCAHPIQDSFSQMKESESCDCPPACESVAYSPIISFSPFSKFAAKQQAEKLRTQIGDTLLQDIIKTRELDLIHITNMQAELDVQLIVSTIVRPIANYMERVPLSYADIAQVGAAVQELATLWTNMTHSSPFSLFSEVMFILAGTNDALRILDLSVSSPETYDKPGASAYSGTKAIFQYLIENEGRSATFEMFAIGSGYYNVTVSVRDTLAANALLISKKIGEIYYAFSISVPADKLQPLNETGSIMPALITRLVTNAYALQSLVSKLVDGMNGLAAGVIKATKPFSMDDINESFVRKNMLKLDIFFTEMRYTKISQQKADSPLGIICDIGGTFGLCLGASIMSIFELVDLIINIILMRSYRIAAS